MDYIGLQCTCLACT